MSITLDPVTGAEVEVDPITGQPVVRNAMGEIIDHMTGLPRDPMTGLPRDPATGLPKDPMTGQTKDPITGSLKDTAVSEPIANTPVTETVLLPSEPLDPRHPHAPVDTVVKAELNRLNELSMSLPPDERTIEIRERIVQADISNPSAAGVAKMLATAADHRHVPSLTGMVEAEAFNQIDGLVKARDLVLSAENLPPDFDPRNIREMEVKGKAGQNVKKFTEFNLHKEKMQGKDLPPLSDKGALV